MGEFVGKELQGDVATELQVFRLVHNTHPAPTQLLDNAVVRDGLADHRPESYVDETLEVNQGQQVCRCSFPVAILSRAATALYSSLYFAVGRHNLALPDYGRVARQSGNGSLF